MVLNRFLYLNAGVLHNIIEIINGSSALDEFSLYKTHWIHHCVRYMVYIMEAENTPYRVAGRVVGTSRCSCNEIRRIPTLSFSRGGFLARDIGP